MKEPQKLFVAIYSRKSRFTGKGESIENQIELCRQYIRSTYTARGEVDILIYEDEGFSGGNTERPHFKQMMLDARQHKFIAVVCYRLDRISRNIGDFAALIEELNGLNIEFISIKEQFDTSSPMGRAMMYICSVFSQLERETIAERIRDNMHELSKTGRWLGGMTPLGYVSESIEHVTVEGKVKKACKLKLIPEEADLVRLIFSKFLETNSLSKTETFLVQNNITTRRGILFNRFSIKNIIMNPVYMIADKYAYKYLTENEVDLFASETQFDGRHGVMAYNRTIQKTGAANKIRPMDEWIVSVGKHTGIISGEEWIKAQSNLEQNRSKSFRKPRSNVALLSGLLRCADCGDFMRPKLSSRLDSNNERIYTYVCTMKEISRGQRCKLKNANGNILDKAVCDEIKRLGEDSSEFIRQLENGKQEISCNHHEIEADIERLKKAVDENDKEIKALVASLASASGSSAEAYIIRQIEQLHDKREMLNQRVLELEGLTKSHALSTIEFDIIRQMLFSFRDTLDDMNVEQKRSVLRSFVQKVTWDGKNAHIYLFGSVDEDDIDIPEEIMGPIKQVTKPLCEDSK